MGYPVHMENKKGCSIPKAHIRFIIGIIFTILVVISEIATIILWNQNNEYLKKSTLLLMMISTELMISIVLTITVLIGLYQINALGQRILKMNLDTGLLALGQIGILIYAGFTMIGSYFQIFEQNIDKYELVKQILIFCTALFNFAQSVLQTILIMVGNCKKPSSTENQNMQMSGLSVLIFLAISNFTIWIILICNIAGYPGNIQMDNFCGNLAWTVIQTSVLPLVMFYRFQSSVCFIEIWKRAYCTSKNILNYY